MAEQGSDTGGGESGGSGDKGGGGGGGGAWDIGVNVKKDANSQSRSTSGFFDGSITNYIGGLNVPQYPDFASLNPRRTAKTVVEAADNFLLYAVSAIAGVGVVWLPKK